jgi:CBS domain-containing protein
VAAVSPGDTIRAVADRLAAGDPRLVRHQAMPIVDAAGQLLGIVTQSDILRTLEENPDGQTSVLDAGTRALITAHPDESVFDALTKMLLNNIGQLPVVDRADPRRMVGYINRAGIMACWGSHLHDESVREHGWLRAFRSPAGHASGSGQTLVGNVLEVGETRLRICVNNSVEELQLENPVRGVSPGDRVRVSIDETRGRRVARHVEELSSRQ